MVTGRYNGVVNLGNITLPNSGFHTGIFLTKLDSTGNFLWANSGFTDYFVWTNSVTTDLENNYYISGDFTLSIIIDSIELNNTGNWDPYIAKFSDNGNLLWLKQLYGEGEGFARFINYYDGNLYQSGGFEDTLYVDNKSIISDGYDDVFLGKYDTLGNCLWLKKIISSNVDDAVKSMSLDFEGNLLITGFFSNIASVGDTSITSLGDADGCIIKVDSSGTVLWARQFGGTSLDIGMSTCSDNNGNVFVKGIFNGTATFGDTTLTAVNGMNFFLTKLDPQGDFIWARRMLIPCWLYEDYYFNSITSDETGNLYATFWFADTVQFDDITLTGSGNYDSFVMKLSPEGDALWAMQLSSPGYVHSRSITNDNNGNLYVTGWFNDVMTYGDSSITPYGGADVFIAKLHEEPVSVSYNEITATLEISVYPNPTTEYVNIGNAEQQIEKAEIISMSGKIVRTFNSNLKRLDVTGLRNGTYLLKLYEHNIIFVTKIIIQ